jgi:hypothetical protein
MRGRRLHSCRLASYNKSGLMFLLVAYIFKSITSCAASQVWPPSRGDLTLADPNPANQEPIHLLIGTDLYGSLLGDFHQGPLGLPTVQKTTLGWIISSPIDIASRNMYKVQMLHCIFECNTDSLLQKSWADEKIFIETQKPKYVDCASKWADILTGLD